MAQQQEHHYGFLQDYAQTEIDALRKEPGPEATAALAKLGAGRRAKRKKRALGAAATAAAAASGGNHTRRIRR